MFKKELDYFISNQDKLVKKYFKKILVIKGEDIIGIYETPLEAYLETKKNHEIGTFLIQPCEKGPEAYTVTLSSHNLIYK